MCIFYSDSEGDTSTPSPCIFIQMKRVHPLPFKEQLTKWIIKVKELSM